MGVGETHPIFCTLHSEFCIKKRLFQTAFLSLISFAPHNHMLCFFAAADACVGDFFLFKGDTT